jgi:hypothetical protein
MRPIPLNHRKIISTDPYFKFSCLSGKPADFANRIVIHHAWEYAGRQINELWNYCPLLESEHAYNSGSPSAHNDKSINDRVKLIAIGRTTIEYLQTNFPKKDWLGEIKKIKYNLSNRVK